MPKCKKCEDGRDYGWDKNHGEATGKWRLWDNERETPHECSSKKKHKFKIKTETLWKKDWKPEMDLPVVRLCGICNNGTKCIVNEDCESCKPRKLSCKEWCPICEKHPNIILVTSDENSRLKND